MITREGTLDETIIREVKGYFPIFKHYKGGTILDIGANIGAFSHLCEKKFPNSQIIAFEPEEENFKMLQKNAPNVTHIRACVTKENGTQKLYLNWGKNKGLHSTSPRRGRNEVQEVRAISFGELLEKYQPEILKIDIEDGEYQFMDELCNLPSCVKAIAIELHLRPETFRLQKAPKIVEGILSKIPYAITKTEIPEKAWATVFMARMEK